MFGCSNVARFVCKESLFLLEGPQPGCFADQDSQLETCQDFCKAWQLSWTVTTMASKEPGMASTAPHPLAQQDMVVLIHPKELKDPMPALSLKDIL